MFFSYQIKFESEMEESICLEMRGCTEPQKCDDTGCNFQPVGLIQPELCHTKVSQCCVDREGGGERTLREKT